MGRGIANFGIIYIPSRRPNKTLVFVTFTWDTVRLIDIWIIWLADCGRRSREIYVPAESNVTTLLIRNCWVSGEAVVGTKGNQAVLHSSIRLEALKRKASANTMHELTADWITRMVKYCLLSEGPLRNWFHWNNFWLRCSDLFFQGF